MSTDPIRDSASYEGRIGESMPRRDVERPAPAPRTRLRDRIPTLQQLQSLIRDGRLMLPPRYFRGFFLDMLV